MCWGAGCPAQLCSVFPDYEAPSQRPFFAFYFFTSRCLARDLPTFRVRQAHKNPGGFSGRGRSRPSSWRQGKGKRRCEGYRARRKTEPWLLFLYLSELLCPAEGTTYNKKKRHFWSGARGKSRASAEGRGMGTMLGPPLRVLPRGTPK